MEVDALCKILNMVEAEALVYILAAKLAEMGFERLRNSVGNGGRQKHWSKHRLKG